MNKRLKFLTLVLLLSVATPAFAGVWWQSGGEPNRPTPLRTIWWESEWCTNHPNVQILVNEMLEQVSGSITPSREQVTEPRSVYVQRPSPK